MLSCDVHAAIIEAVSLDPNRTIGNPEAMIGLDGRDLVPKHRCRQLPEITGESSVNFWPASARLNLLPSSRIRFNSKPWQRSNAKMSW